MERQLTKFEEEIVNRFYNAGKLKLIEFELYDEIIKFENLLFKDKDFRKAQLFILDLGKDKGFSIDKKIQEEFSGWWW